MKQTSQKILEAPLHFPEAQEQPIAFTNPTLSGLGELNGLKSPSAQAQHRWDAVGFVPDSHPPLDTLVSLCRWDLETSLYTQSRIHFGSKTQAQT